MEIKIQIKDRVFSLCIGHKCKWFEQLPFITFVEEFYNEKREIVYASFKWSFGKQYQKYGTGLSLKGERVFKLTNKEMIFFAVFLVIAILFAFSLMSLINKCSTEIETRGLKNIIEEIWEGKNKPNHQSVTKTLRMIEG